MTYEERWIKIEEIGTGGQGKVYRVLDANRFGTSDQIRKSLQYSMHRLSLEHPNPATIAEDFETFRDSLVRLLNFNDPSFNYALKVLHKPENARDRDRSFERVKNEIDAMSRISHPNLLRIIDHNSTEGWFVSPFYPRGTLLKHLSSFKGDVAKSLKAFRPLVSGVAELHKEKIVHRDIKPQNIFIDSSDNLVLGDFGLVFFSDIQHTRVSSSFENVGTRDWMPPWAMGMRIQAVRSSFDVFSLGKVLWSMVSGLPILQLWYFDRQQFDVQSLFPRAAYTGFLNQLLSKCIVENEPDCLPDASSLLSEIDRTLEAIQLNADTIQKDARRICRVCGAGEYQLVADRNPIGIQRMGLRPASGITYKAFACSNCGHVQLFSFRANALPKAWD
jgi:serine/threonine protein kinase